MLDDSNLLIQGNGKARVNLGQESSTICRNSLSKDFESEINLDLQALANYRDLPMRGRADQNRKLEVGKDCALAAVSRT